MYWIFIPQNKFLCSKIMMLETRRMSSSPDIDFRRWDQRSKKAMTDRIAANASLCRWLLARSSRNEHLLGNRATGKYFLSPGLLLVISRDYDSRGRIPREKCVDNISLANSITILSLSLPIKKDFYHIILYKKKEALSKWLNSIEKNRLLYLSK